MSKIISAFRFWFPVISWASVIFVFSGFSTPRTSEFFWQDFVTKKAAHLTEYAILFIFVYRAVKNTTKLNLTKVAVLSLVLVVFYAMSDEIHQTFVASRQGTPRDVLIDFVGACLALLGVWSYLPKAPRRLKNWAKNWQLIS